MTARHPAPLEEVIARHGLQTKKSLGQHFLLDAHLCEQIAALAGDLSGRHVIEIGPGPGGLTRALLTSKAASITAIEKDARALPALEELQPFSDGRLRLLQEDALQADLLALIPDRPRVIVANLPYNVGTDLLLNWLGDIQREAQSYESLTLMFQKEVGERIVAQPGSKAYGRLSVLAQWLCEAELRMLVPPEAFSPPPKVESVIVQLIPRAQPLYAAPAEALQEVVRTAFAQRRKMLRTALKPLTFQQSLAELSIDETYRADQLDLAAYCRLANALTRR